MVCRIVSGRLPAIAQRYEIPDAAVTSWKRGWSGVCSARSARGGGGEPVFTHPADKAAAAARTGRSSRDAPRRDVDV
jgi:hypothetical protein